MNTRPLKSWPAGLPLCMGEIALLLLACLTGGLAEPKPTVRRLNENTSSRPVAIATASSVEYADDLDYHYHGHANANSHQTLASTTTTQSTLANSHQLVDPVRGSTFQNNFPDGDHNSIAVNSSGFSKTKLPEEPESMITRLFSGKQQNAPAPNISTKCPDNKYDAIIKTKLERKELSKPIVKEDGRYDNPWSTWQMPAFTDILKFVVTGRDTPATPNKEELDTELPIVKSRFQLNETHKQDQFRLTWIGHSTALIQVNGLNILTDPIFSERASFNQWIGPKRIREPSSKVSELPDIDVVIVSHSHYDHLDSNSVSDLNARFGANIRWLVPLGLGEYLRSMSVTNYVELDWWQKDCVFNKGQTSKDEASKCVSVYLTPNQHWSRRSLNDINKSLWGSYTIVSAEAKTFFFGGDTGYCPVFKEIGEVFGPFTGAAIPIGAYKPRWFMRPAHVNPEEAVEIHRDLRSHKSVSIHHSTFMLSNEGYKEPSAHLGELMQDLRDKENFTQPFISVRHGETVDFD